MDRISQQLDQIISELGMIRDQKKLDREILSIPQAAEYLGISEYTLRDWVRGRTIPFSKMNGSIRFKKSKLDRWLDRCEVPMQ